MLVFLTIVVLGWVVCAALYEATWRQAPWREQAGKRTQATLMREIAPWGFGLQLLTVILGAAAVAIASVKWAHMGLLWALPVILTNVLVALWIVRQGAVQGYVISFVAFIARKWGGRLGFIKHILRVCTHAGCFLFAEVPAYRTKRELAGFVRHHHRQHGGLGGHEQAQVEALLRCETEPVAPLVIPLKKAVMVGAEDTVGPLLLSELHDSSHMAFAVYRGKKRDNIVGVLDQGVAVSHAKTSTKVASLMDERLVYVPQEATWQQALQTFIETSASLSVIIDQNNDPAGVLYVQDILRALFGSPEEEHENPDQRTPR